MDKARICRELAEKLRWSYTQGLRDDDVFNPFDSAEDCERLFKALPEPELYMESSKGDVHQLWGCWADINANPEDGYACNKDLRTAIVLSACRWLCVEE